MGALLGLVHMGALLGLVHCADRNHRPGLWCPHPVRSRTNSADVRSFCDNR